VNGLVERAAMNKQRIEMVYIFSKEDLSQRRIRVLKIRDDSILTFCLVRRKGSTFKRENILSLFLSNSRKEVAQ